MRFSLSAACALEAEHLRELGEQLWRRRQLRRRRGGAGDSADSARLRTGLVGANPTVVARLTGAEPGRVRAVARTAASPAELPPAPELFAQLAEVLGLEGAGRG
jgi:hypothetical protein